MLVACCAAWFTGPANAQTGAGVELLRGDYESVERLDSGLLANRESGALDGARLRVWRDWQDWRVGVGASHLDGNVAYRGRSQIGLPVRTQTRLAIDELAVYTRWQFTPTATLDAALTAALGIRRIDRRIAASLFTTPLTEVLHWRYAQLGAQARWNFADNWFATAGAQLEQGLGARLAVDFHGVADPATLRPGNDHLGRRLELQIGRRLGASSTLVLLAGRSRHRYAGSAPRAFTRAGQTIGQVRYPGSVQQFDDVGLRLEMVWN